MNMSAVNQEVSDELTDTCVPTETMESVREKRSSKLTPKALQQKLDTLHKTRASKLQKINNLMVMVKNFLPNREYEKEVQCLFDKVVKMCDEAIEMHNSLIVNLPSDQKENQQTWFSAKMLIYNGFIDDVKKWLLNAECQVSCSGVNDNALENDVEPNDSISNISSRVSNLSSKKSSSSVNSHSSTSSARILAEAERAALIARAAALKEKHVLDVQQEQLRRRQEQLDIDAEIAATTAKIAVLKGSDSQDPVNPSNAMNAYYDRGMEMNNNENILNPHAQEYIPSTSSQHNGLRKESQNVQSMTQFNAPIPQVQTSNTMHVNSTSTSAIYNVMQRQNEITALLVEHQQANTLPQREIPVFDGNPLQYRTFVRAFKHGIEDKTKNNCDRLYFLEQYTRGQPRELVRSCQHMDAQIGYVQAKTLLKEQFGNEFKIAAAFLEKVRGWPSVKSEDVSSLQSYALYLRGCSNAMEEIKGLKELEMPSNLKTIIMKLPFKLREKWRTVSCDIFEKCKRRAQFKDVVEFIERQVRISSDPFFGDIQGSQVVTLKSQPKVKSRTSFATTVVQDSKFIHTQDSDQTSRLQVTCLCCKRGHLLERCSQMQNKAHREKLEFLKENGICFGCLCVGHRSKDCDKRLTCTVCGQSHPSILHIYPKTST